MSVEHATENDRHLPESVREFFKMRRTAELSIPAHQRSHVQWSRRGCGPLVGRVSGKIVYDGAVSRAREVLAKSRLLRKQLSR